MIPKISGRRVTYDKEGNVVVSDFDGFYLKMDELIIICRDFNNRYSGTEDDKTYLENKLKEMA